MLLTSQQASQIAQIIDTGFTEYRKQFEKISSGARQRFEKALWQEVQTSGMQRIDLYGEMVNEVTNRLAEFRATEGIAQEKARAWITVKTQFEQLMLQRTDPELAETFYNSIFCRTFRHKALREYDASKGVVNMVSKILDDYSYDIPYVNKRLDVINLVRNIKDNTDFRMAITADTRVQILKSVFYRNKGGLFSRAVGKP